MHFHQKSVISLSAALTALQGFGAVTHAAGTSSGISSFLQSLQLGNESIQSFSDSISPVPFNQDFPDSPKAWNISIDPRFINVTNLKVALTRYHNDIKEPDWTEGPPRNNISELRDYWLNEYDWKSVEDDINQRFNNHITSVKIPGSNYTEPVKLHFVHHTSKRPDAIPFLFMHGTPGNFMEVGGIIDGLTNPPPEAPAFHVVAPSMPGYGFSPAPEVPGVDPAVAAGAMNQLMQQLGYDRYVVQGGDYGGITLRFISALYPQNVVSSLCNFFIVEPNSTDIARYHANQTTPDETKYISSVLYFGQYASGYRELMGLTPLQACVATTDSPLGNLAFNWNLQHSLSDPDFEWTLEQIITWNMMYYIPGPFASMRHYREMAIRGIHAGPFFGNNYPFVHVPMGITEFPGDFWYGLPIEWAQRFSNTNWRTMHTKGAHFPAFQNSAALIEDIRYYFGNSTLSNTTEWRNASQAQPYQYIA